MWPRLDFLRYLDIWDYLLAMVDIAVVSWAAYHLLLLIRGTRAVQLIRGLVVLVLASFASQLLGLHTIQWVLEQTRLMVLVALPIVFQPELRRALEQLGRGKLFARPLGMMGTEETSKVLEEIVRAVTALARHKFGALIVWERETGINEVLETGVKIDGVVSAEFLINLFTPRTPLHDGAAIIRGDRVVAAGCFLPLTDSPYLSQELGTRHRAALGISEVSDAVAIIVSEETGVISVAENGQLTRYLDEKSLRQLLSALLESLVQGGFSWHRRV